MTSSPPRSLAIFGATGTIGASAMKVLETSKEPYVLSTLVGNRNIETMKELALQHQPLHIGMQDENAANTLKEALNSTLPSCQVVGGKQALLSLASKSYDWSLMGISGLYDALPLLSRLLASSKTVALANKECLVCAGEILLSLAHLHKTTILPVDSEHNALFQLATSPSPFDAVTLTASGGACRDMPLDQLYHASPSQVLDHPIWPMGDKLTVDSANMVNKGLEIIEAALLFSLPEDRIRVLLHRESIVHALLHYPDGSHTAMLSLPNMQIAIAHCFAYPKRMTLPLPPLDLTSQNLSFSPPSPQRYPALELARQALRQGISARIAYWVASEIATSHFLSHSLPFGAIPSLINLTMKETANTPPPSSLDSTLSHAKNIARTTLHIIENQTYMSLIPSQAPS